LSLSVSIDRVEVFTIVRVDGELDHATAPVLAATLDGRIGTGTGPVVVDLTNLRFIDSSGLGVLVSCHRALRRQHGSLHLAGPSPRITKLLGLTGLDLVFDIHHSVQAAVEYAHAPG
jgi:anti-sigma B factor antagonist